MDKNEQEIWDELYQTYQLVDSESKTAVLEGLLGIAEGKNLDAVAFSIRLEIVQSTVFSGDIEKALVAFTHCVAEFDAEKEYALAETFSVLWSSKWINRTIVAFPNITKQQIDDIENDIADRFERHGFGLRSHYMFGWLNAIEMGNQEKANRRRKQWIKETIMPGHPRCKACELHYEIHYQIQENQPEKGLNAYRSLLRSKEVCNRVPLASHVLMLPFLKPETDEGRAAFLFALFEFEPANIDRVSLAGDFLFYLLDKDDAQSALKIASNYLGPAMKTKDLDQKLHFFIAAERFFNTTNGFSFPWRHLDQEFALAELKCFLESQINRLALAFDSRNQNTFVSDYILAKRASYRLE